MKEILANCFCNFLAPAIKICRSNGTKVHFNTYLLVQLFDVASHILVNARRLIGASVRFCVRGWPVMEIDNSERVALTI